MSEEEETFGKCEAGALYFVEVVSFLTQIKMK
jgi:hypothetical protein